MSGDHAHCQPDHGCITCGDQALEMQVLSVDAAQGLATCVDESGRREEIDTLLVAPTAAGERLLVHARVAIARLGTGAAA